MKKLSRKRKAHLLRKQNRATKKLQAGNRRRGDRQSKVTALARRRREKRIRLAPTRNIPAPAVFSLVRNTEDVVRFMDDVERTTAQGVNVYVDLSGVTSITADAAAVLASRVQNERYAHGMSVSGNVPEDPGIREVLVETGFFNHVKPTGIRPVPSGAGQILTQQSYKVEAEATDALIRRALDIVPGDFLVLDGVQSVVVEAMNNTENHAASRLGRELWWFSVYCDREAGVVQFCFFDNGVGIFESLEKKGLWEDVKKLFGLNDRPTFLQRVLAGKVPSSTGVPHRGKGLPNIAAVRRRNPFQRLIILSNSVLADVDQNDFRSLPVSFSGTLIYMEHHAD